MRGDRGSEGLVGRLSDSQYIENLEASLDYYQKQINEMDDEINKLKSDNAYLSDCNYELKEDVALMRSLYVEPLLKQIFGE